MSRKGKLPVKGYSFFGIVLLLVVTSVLIAQRLLTAEYPTHSDVFFMGVECGVLGVVLFMCLFLICLILYRLAARKPEF